MKEKSKDPVYLLEVPHPLRHIIMKRGHLLRSVRTRGIGTLNRSGENSWIQSRMKASGGEEAAESWDFAHELSRLFQTELSQEVYVEPGSKVGRYQALVRGSEDQNESAAEAAGRGSPHTPAFNFGSGANFASGISGLGMTGGVSSPFSLSSGHAGALPGVPDPVSAIKPKMPGEAQAGNAKSEIGVECPSLRSLAGWETISPVKQRMFETESAQLIKKGLALEPGVAALTGETGTLHMLSMQPNASRQLKRFLAEALS